MNSQLISFYRGKMPDIAGRNIDDIWQWDHDRLERCHDYIQWLFPLAMPSKFNANAPLLDAETIAAFNHDPDLQERLQKSFLLFLDFLGLQQTGSPDDGTLQVSKTPSYENRRGNWQNAPMPGYINHNLLRISRVLECLLMLGLVTQSKAFYCCLEAIQAEQPALIPVGTLNFWRKASGQA